MRMGQFEFLNQAVLRMQNKEEMRLALSTYVNLIASWGMYVLQSKFQSEDWYRKALSKIFPSENVESPFLQSLPYIAPKILWTIPTLKIVLAILTTARAIMLDYLRNLAYIFAQSLSILYFFSSCIPVWNICFYGPYGFSLFYCELWI